MKKTLLAVALAQVCLPSMVYADTSTDEVMVVTANRIEQSTQSVAAQVEVVTRDDIERIQAKSLIDVFRRLTGVQVTQNGGRGQLASIFVRGANADQVLVLVDGVRFNRATKGSVDFSQVPVNFVDRIEYVRGARASVYGSEAIGGVINIITLANSKTNNTTKLAAGVGSLDYREASLTTGVEVGEQGHLNLALGYDADDGYNVKPQPGINDGDRHGFESLNGLAGYSHRFDDSWSAFANFRIFDNTYQYDGTFTSRQLREAEVENYALSSGVEYQRNAVSSQFSVNWQNQEDWDYIQSEGKGSSGASNDELDQLNLQWNAQYQLTQQITFAGGVDWRDETYKVKTSGDKFERDNLAVYGIAVADYDAFFGELSLRLDDNEQFGSESTYNLGLGYRFSELLAITTSYGTSFKAPNLYQLYNGLYGNQSLKPESADSFELTVSGLLADVHWSVTGYDTRIDDLIDFNSSTSRYYNVNGESKLQGIEIVTEFDTAFISHQLSADFKDPEDRNGEQLVRRAKKMFKYNAIASFDVVDVSLGYQYVGERPDFGGDLDAYNLFDLSANYYANEHLTLNARIDNVFDEDYETAAGYPAPERAFYMNASYEF
ncbi:TonB-dependent vitamin B12 receptor [Photobacterium rosenbergii]|uniref:Vitamin B12 transporter BtuB n=1 Tax=Photobacterium rosenbergii TaxID=294936 RepID=A0A2T3N7G5_9GAMM|nr:TonB-dependent vitamin B12 receptor [Photobacterium rosenbergii]PSW09001.1 TonB-dependent vitamin B12 receptor [Photobacterium rosenbergii]